MTNTSKRTSELVSGIIAQSGRKDVITIGEFVEALGERAFGIAILIFALPNSLPIPGIPGFSTITGIPLMFFALQMLLRPERFYLPARIRKIEFSQAKLAQVLTKGLPYLQRLEKYLCPRLLFLSTPPVERLIGVVIIVLAILLSFPIPLGNFLPGLSIAILALGLMERDGVTIIGGFILSVVATIVISTGILLVLKAVWLAITKTIGM